MDHLHPLFDRALDAVVGMDHRGTVVAWNRAAETLFGWSRSEVDGRKMADLIIPPQHRESHEKGLSHYNRTGHGPVLEKRVEITALDRSGTEFPIELSIFPMRQSGGDVFYAFIRSLVPEEHHRRELALRSQEAELLFSVAETLLEDMSLEDFTRFCLTRVCDLAGLQAAHLFNVREIGGEPWLVSAGVWYISDPRFRPVIEDTAARRFALGEGNPGKAWQTRDCAIVEDVTRERTFLRRESFARVGLTKTIAVPVTRGTQVHAVMEFFGVPSSRFDAYLVRLIDTVAKNVGVAIQKKEDAEQRALLRKELAHRVGNSMAILSAIFRASARRATSVEELSSSFAMSLDAVARAHRDIEMATSTVTLKSLLEEPLRLLQDQSRTKLDIPEFLVLPDASLSLSLLFVELVTNHLKHCPEADLGRIAVDASIDVEHDDLILNWRETFEPRQTSEPVTAGYGTFLIRAMIEERLNGRFERELGAEGVTCRVRIPVRAALQTD